MSSGIKAGDLVVVVKPSTCCDNSESIGKIFNVSKISLNQEFQCEKCGALGFSSEFYFLKNEHAGHSMERVRKIEPLKEEELHDFSTRYFRDALGNLYQEDKLPQYFRVR